MQSVTQSSNELQVVFESSQSYNTAKSSWVSSPNFVVATNTDGIGATDGQRSFWLVNQIDPQDAQQAITCQIQREIPIGEVMAEVDISWGTYKPDDTAVPTGDGSPGAKSDVCNTKPRPKAPPGSPGSPSGSSSSADNLQNPDDSVGGAPGSSASSSDSQNPQGPPPGFFMPSNGSQSLGGPSGLNPGGSIPPGSSLSPGSPQSSNAVSRSGADNPLSSNTPQPQSAVSGVTMMSQSVPTPSGSPYTALGNSSTDNSTSDACGPPPAPQIDGFPTGACGSPTFDKDIDDEIGYLDFNSDLGGSLGDFAPGVDFSDASGNTSTRLVRRSRCWTCLVTVSDHTIFR